MDGNRQMEPDHPKRAGIWACKIGECDWNDVPQGGDAPMRDAIERGYQRTTGHSPEFIFSGWSAELDESERAVVENRMPVYELTAYAQQEERDRLRAEVERLTHDRDAFERTAALQAEEADRAKAENDRLREELGYRPAPENGYCVACGCYMPKTLDGTSRVHDCNRTPPLGNLPTTIYACLTCGGHAPFAAGCWGALERPHEHTFMRPVHEIVAELRAASDEDSAA